jgi:Protein of unknown function (DUF2958)
MREPPDHRPVVKLFTPDVACTWLLTEIDPDAPDIAFGLCDLGMGFQEIGSVSLSEIDGLRGRLGLPVDRDLHWGTIRFRFTPGRPAGRTASTGGEALEAAIAEAYTDG